MYLGQDSKLSKVQGQGAAHDFGVEFEAQFNQHNHFAIQGSGKVAEVVAVPGHLVQADDVLRSRHKVGLRIGCCTRLVGSRIRSPVQLVQ